MEPPWQDPVRCMRQQVVDDPQLLELTVQDYLRSSGEFGASARWLQYSDRFLAYLREQGLKDFRSRRHPKGTPGAVLASFGAVDLNPSFDRCSPIDLYHAAATCYLGEGAVHISQLSPSQVASPEGFCIDGRFYTLSWLNFYCRYAYVSKFVRFERQTIVEVGCGSGKQAELLKKAHPDLTIVLFDLPTQLYVAHQYLAAVFSDSDEVVDYRTTRTFRSFDDIRRRKINILPNWLFPIVRGAAIDLLWNAASFQEMAPEVALSYLRAASSAAGMFLMHNIKYKPDAPWPGSRGVIDPAHLPGFREVDRTPARLALTPATWLYFDSLWKRDEPWQAQ